MTTLNNEEKLSLVTGKGAWHTSDCNGKLPSLLMTDGPHGLRKQDEGVRENDISVRATCFPAACAIAASWDTKVSALMAKAIAKEAIAEGVGIVLGPGANIKRSPTCGRNFEYFSEDPELAGRMAASYINAIQEEGVGTSLKHFAANNQESYRMTGDSRVDVRTLREIYLRAFEIAVKEASPATIMASYNKINGVYSCENKWLLTDVLRKEWGYDGTVISDWGACARLTQSLMAGMNLEMPDSNGNHYKKAYKDLKTGVLSQKKLDMSADLVKKLVLKYNREPLNLSKSDKDKILSNNHNTAVRIEEQCAVLLKNNGVLPIDKSKNKKVVIIGDMARKVRIQGGGSSHINTDNVMTIFEALSQEGFTCKFVSGYDSNTNTIDREKMSLACLYAEQAYKHGIPLVFCGGLTDFAEGEGYDRTSFDMPNNQAVLLRKITKINPDTIFLSFAGSPFDLSPADRAGAILMMYLGGEGVSEAAAGLLSGRVNPSGKLPETFPIKLSDTPCYNNFGANTRNPVYSEKLFVGYRYYDSYNIPVKYPFGFGLSYTQFNYSDLSVTKKDGDGVEVTFTVTNAKDIDGAEISEIFIKNPKANFIRANRELRGFGKTVLKGGESKRVSIMLPWRSFEVFDVKTDKYVTIPGEYEIEVASSINDIRLTSLVKIDGVMPEIEKRRVSFAPQGRNEDIEEYTIQNSLGQLASKSYMGKVLLRIMKYAGYAMFKGKSKNDPEVMMFIEAIKEGTVDCVMNNADGILPYRVGEAIVLSANNHKLEAILKLFRD